MIEQSDNTLAAHRRTSWVAGALALLFGLPGLADTDAAQPMRFERLTAEDGLAQNSVMAIAQDTRGFLWFATENGLNRYDGLGFLHFQFDRADPTSLPADYVTDLVLAADDSLWLATDGGGIARWDAGNAAFERLTTEHGLSDNKVQKLAFDRRGYLWIGTLRDGLNRLDLATGDIRSYRHTASDPNSLSSDTVRALYVDDASTLWVGTNAGLDRIDADGASVTRVARGGDTPTNIAGDRVRTILKDRSGTLWVGTQRGGLSRSDDDGASFRHYRNDGAAGSLSHNRVEALLEDASGRLWIATADGLNRYLNGPDQFAAYRYAAETASSLSDNNTISLFQDRGGLVWVGTKTAGVNKWNPRTWSFGHIRPEVSDDASGRIRHVTSFADDPRGGVWFGSFGAGLTRLSPDGAIVERITSTDERQRQPRR